MSEPKSLFVLLGEIGVVRPYLVLQRGRRYWRIEDLLKFARKDLKSGDEQMKEALSYPAYVTHTDEIGKVSIRDVQSGKIQFSEVGAMELAPPVPGE